MSITDEVGRMFEGGSKIRKILMEKVIDQCGMDRAAMVFGMMELIVDLKPEGTSMRQWGNEVAGVFGHFSRQKDGTETKQ